MNDHSSITLPRMQRQDLDRRIAERFERLRIYARPENLSALPSGLREPLSRSEYKALTVAERERHLLAVVRAQLTEQAKSKAAAIIAARQHAASIGTPAPAMPWPGLALTPSSQASHAARAPLASPVTASQPDPAEAALASFTPRAYVPCIGCGELVPARPGRPAIRACSPAPAFLAGRQSARRRRAICGVSAWRRFGNTTD